MKTEVIYFGAEHIASLDEKLGKVSRLSGSADTSTRREFLLALQTAVGRSDIIIAVGRLFGKGGLSAIIAAGTGLESEVADMRSLGLAVDPEVVLPHAALPLIDEHSSVSGFIIECDSQSIIAISPDEADDMTAAYIVPYVTAKGGAEPQSEPSPADGPHTAAASLAPSGTAATEPTGYEAATAVSVAPSSESAIPQFDEVNFAFDDEDLGEEGLLIDERHTLRNTLIVLAVVVVLVVGGLCGFRYLYEPNNCRAVYTSARDKLGTADSALPTDALSKYGALYADNDDLLGWISIDGTGIDYPVVAVDEGSKYYRSHLFNNSFSTYGTPYTYGQYNQNGCSTNLIIYGANRGDGLMFSDLDKFTDRAFAEQNNTVKMGSIYFEDDWVIASVMLLDDDTVEARFDYASQFKDKAYVSDDFVKFITENAIYKTNVDCVTADYYLSLIAPSKTESGKNVVVVARKIRASETADESLTQSTGDPMLSDYITADLSVGSSVPSSSED